MLEVGDSVKITDKGQCCCIYQSFMHRSGIGIDKWGDGDLPNNGDKGIIIYIENSGLYTFLHYLVEINNRHYIMLEKGMEIDIRRKKIMEVLKS